MRPGHGPGSGRGRARGRGNGGPHADSTARPVLARPAAQRPRRARPADPAGPVAGPPAHFGPGRAGGGRQLPYRSGQPARPPRCGRRRPHHARRMRAPGGAGAAASWAVPRWPSPPGSGVPPTRSSIPPSPAAPVCRWPRLWARSPKPAVSAGTSPPSVPGSRPRSPPAGSSSCSPWTSSPTRSSASCPTSTPVTGPACRPWLWVCATWPRKASRSSSRPCTRARAPTPPWPRHRRRRPPPRPSPRPPPLRLPPRRLTRLLPPPPPAPSTSQVTAPPPAAKADKPAAADPEAETTFFTALEASCLPAAVAAVRQLYNTAAASGRELQWGQGEHPSVTAVFDVGGRPVGVWSCYTDLKPSFVINFEWLVPHVSIGRARARRRRARAAPERPRAARRSVRSQLPAAAGPRRQCRPGPAQRRRSDLRARWPSSPAPPPPRPAPAKGVPRPGSTGVGAGGSDCVDAVDPDLVAPR